VVQASGYGTENSAETDLKDAVRLSADRYEALTGISLP